MATTKLQIYLRCNYPRWDTPGPDPQSARRSGRIPRPVPGRAARGPPFFGLLVCSPTAPAQRRSELPDQTDLVLIGHDAGAARLTTTSRGGGQLFPAQPCPQGHGEYPALKPVSAARVFSKRRHDSTLLFLALCVAAGAAHPLDAAVAYLQAGRSSAAPRMGRWPVHRFRNAAQRSAIP